MVKLGNYFGNKEPMTTRHVIEQVRKRFKFTENQALGFIKGATRHGEVFELYLNGNHTTIKIFYNNGVLVVKGRKVLTGYPRTRKEVEIAEAEAGRESVNPSPDTSILSHPAPSPRLLRRLASEPVRRDDGGKEKG